MVVKYIIKCMHCHTTSASNPSNKSARAIINHRAWCATYNALSVHVPLGRNTSPLVARFSTWQSAAVKLHTSVHDGTVLLLLPLWLRFIDIGSHRPSNKARGGKEWRRGGRKITEKWATDTLMLTRSMREETVVSASHCQRILISRQWP